MSGSDCIRSSDYSEILVDGSLMKSQYVESILSHLRKVAIAENPSQMFDNFYGILPKLTGNFSSLYRFPIHVIYYVQQICGCRNTSIFNRLSCKFLIFDHLLVKQWWRRESVLCSCDSDFSSRFKSRDNWSGWCGTQVHYWFHVGT